MTDAADARPDAPRIVRVEAVDSTQTLVFELAAQGAPDGSAVVAGYQREGRGRQGRSWYAPPGTALLTSMLVRPPLPLRDLPLYSFVAAVATAEAVERLTGHEPRLKWPNDVLLGDRKVAGILLESRTSPGAPPVVAIGIGLNLAQRSFPPALADRATSLALETAREIGVDEALVALLDGFRAWRSRLETAGFGPVRARWLAVAHTIGRRVRMDGLDGIAVDLAGDGALVVDEGGRRRHVFAGEIRWDSPRVLDLEPVEPDAPRR